jgi:peroxiredoxin Q/BCP
MATHLQEGEKAPAFTGINEDGEKISLKDFRGQKVILYFYPEDDTPTCTVQACNLRDNYSALLNQDYKVMGISPDTPKKHQKFKIKYNLPFTLIADPEHKIIDAYGVWGEKNLYGRNYMGLHRTTFIINEKGIIEKIIRKPRSKVHAEEILK